MKSLLLTIIFSSLSWGVFAQTPTYVSSDSLFGWWPFNGNVNDSSGNGNHGANNGATLTSDRFGNMNSAYNFDGINDYITINQLFDEPERSVFLWMNVTLLTGNLQAIFGIDHSSLTNGHTLLSVDNNNDLLMNIGFPGYAIKPVSLNTWYHIGCTRSLDSTKLYVNGKVYQTIANGNLRSTHGNNTNIQLGTSRLIDRFFNGKIDDLGIWNRALDSCEVKDLYNSTLNYCSTLTSLNETKKSSFNVFPNPTEDLINVSLSQHDVGGSFVLTDMMGREIINQRVNSSLFLVNLRDVNLNGIFIATVTDRDGHLIGQEKIIYR